MKIAHFKFLKRKMVSDCEMFQIIKYSVFPRLSITFDQFVSVHGLKFIFLNDLIDYPVWEMYLNAIIIEYEISKKDIVRIVKNAICEQREKVRRNVGKIIVT